MKMLPDIFVTRTCIVQTRLTYHHSYMHTYVVHLGGLVDAYLERVDREAAVREQQGKEVNVCYIYTSLCFSYLRREHSNE